MLKKIKQILCYDLLIALIITIKHFFKKKITILYPEQTIPKSSRFRGLHALRRYENGQERCIGCKLCEAVCPALAINIETKINKDGTRRTTKYDIDLFKCIFCGLCEESCPVDAIVQTNISDYHFEKSFESILTKEKLLSIGDKYYAKHLHKDKFDVN